MKRVPTSKLGKEVSATDQMDDRKARMAAYMEQTHPAFVQAVLKSRELGVAANGVLAGPTKRKAK